MTEPTRRRKTLLDAFEDIGQLEHQIEDVSVRAFGFKEENWKGGKFGEVKQEIEAAKNDLKKDIVEVREDMKEYHKGVLALHESLPGLMKDAIVAWQRSRKADVVDAFRGDSRKVVIGILITVIGGLVLALIILWSNAHSAPTTFPEASPTPTSISLPSSNGSH